MPLSVL